MSARATTRRDIESALHKQEFEFYYQPKVSLVTGEICGAEALIRWRKPDGRIILPGAFIPLAESTGLINRLTLVMVKRLVADIRMLNPDSRLLPISFNASAHDFQNRRLVDAILASVEQGQITPSQLEIELTETVLLNESPVVKDNLNRLSELGVKLVMDDYCRGFSSLGTLARWPFSTIKIDKSIVGQVECSDKELSIVQSSIQMAHSMELEIVAEGVETEACYRLLQNTGCGVAQGYWISQPLPLNEFLAFLKENRQWPSQLLGMLHMVQLDHIQWRKAVIDSIYNQDLLSKQKGAGRPERQHAFCRLGKWLDGPGRCFAKTVWYKKLNHTHKALHQTLEQLFASVDSGGSEYRLISLMRKMTNQSDQVLKMLHELEHHLVEQRLLRGEQCSAREGKAVGE